jgi:membrane protease YdiL (CAAX protease family)
VPAWISIVQLFGLGLILVFTALFSSLQPLRGLVLALIAFVLGDWVRVEIENVPVLINWTKTAPQYQWMFLDSLMAVIPGVLMALTLVGSGLKRQDIFLVKGNLGASSKMPFGIRPIAWNWLGPALIIVFSIPLVLRLSLAVEANFLRKLVAALPIAVSFAVVNALSEEFRFRAVLLARIEPVLGSGHALLLTSAVFGLGHWFGHPSGPSGVIMAGIAGWFWGKSMIDTRGIFWAWWSHGIQDVLILTAVVTLTA